MQIYDELQRAYDYFNKVLFDSKLDRCLMTLQRKTNTFAYISFNRFVSINDNQVFMHELALNPEYFGVKPLIEVMQSLCHEMVHLNQYQYGTPSRKSYHNTEFAEMMESIGLIPSDTGRVGVKEQDNKWLIIQNPMDFLLERVMTYLKMVASSNGMIDTYQARLQQNESIVI